MNFNGLMPGLMGPPSPTTSRDGKPSPIVFPGMTLQMPFIPDFAHMMRMNLLYTQAHIDNLLYGYAIAKNSHTSQALSGLTVPNLSQDQNLKNKFINHQPEETLKTEVKSEGVCVLRSHLAGVAHATVISTQTIFKGRQFGPYQGKTVNMSEVKNRDNNSQMWEVFNQDGLQHFIDGRGSGFWMSFVNCARYPQEQNLDVIQVADDIYYEANKDIAVGKELLVWYGDMYNLYMGIPISLKQTKEKSASMITPPLKIMKPEEEGNSEGYTCERCGKVFAYKYYKEKHMKYTRCVDQGDRKFPCSLCTRSFEKRDRLRIHVLHVHEKHRPHKCTVCNKCFSQSSSLNKHMRVHSGERPYKCVYCNKAFTASSILRTHIRQHSGEKPFKCKHCGKAFASHAAHDSHVRRTHSKPKIVGDNAVEIHNESENSSMKEEIEVV